MSSALTPFAVLLKAFVDGRLSAVEVECIFLPLYKHWPGSANADSPAQAALDQFFTDVDAFCGDPDLRDSQDLDEVQLIECARWTLEQMADGEV